jgi:hypothetical protein
MLKNKFTIIALIAILIFSLTIPIVRAENEATAESTNNLIAAPEEHNEDATAAEAHGESNQSPKTDIKKNDVYLMADEVTIDYVVDGNLFVIAKTVNINSQIGGDAFIMASQINVGEQGYIFSNLFALAQELNISGIVYDLYSCSQTTNINGYIYRDIKVTSSTVNINGTVGRNAYVSAENINFPQNAGSEEALISNSKAMIYGDLNYSSPNEIKIPDGSVTGSVNFSKINVLDEKNIGDIIKGYIWDFGTFVATVAIIWLLMLWLAPKFLSKTEYLVSKKIWPSLGFGALTSIVVIFASIILLILGITAKVALLGIGLLVLLLLIGVPIFTISINQFICKKLKIEKNIATFGILIITSAVVWLTTLIPFVGGLINLVIKLIGLGIIVNYVLKNKKAE